MVRRGSRALSRLMRSASSAPPAVQKEEAGDFTFGRVPFVVGAGGTDHVGEVEGGLFVHIWVWSLIWVPVRD